MMALRHRLTLLAAATVGVTVVLVAIVAYAALRSELRGQVDEALTTQGLQIERRARGERFGPALGPELPGPSVRAGGPSGAVQLIYSSGDIAFPAPGDLDVPVDEVDRAIAGSGGQRTSVLRDVRSAEGVHLRVLTAALSASLRQVQKVLSYSALKTLSAARLGNLLRLPKVPKGDGRPG